MSFEEIVRLEPRIGALVEEARERVRRGEQADALCARYKVLLNRLVGWDAPNEQLRESRHYETVIKALCEALDY